MKLIPIYTSDHVRGSSKPGIDNFCQRPTKSATVDFQGNCFLCICESWLPVSVGNITDFDKLEQIWDNPTAKVLQQDVADKKFTYCAVELCGVDQHSIELSNLYRLNLTLDNSCNLACPTCRTSMINFTEGPEYDQRLEYANYMLELLEKFDQPMEVVMLGNGDPLASAVIRPIILNWEPKSSQTVLLFTNGLLMKKLLPKSKMLPHITNFQISIDAGTKEVYNKVRAPGNFDTLIENLNWLWVHKPKDSTVTLKFTVSAENVNDIKNFTNLCVDYGFAGDISKLVDWGTFENFQDHEVIDNTNHPLHKTAIEQLKYANEHSCINIVPSLKKIL